MKQKRKSGRKLLSFLLTLAMVVGLVPGMSLTAYAAEGNIDAFNESLTISSDMTCTRFSVLNGSTLTINQGVTVTLNNPGGNFSFFDESKIELHGTLAGSAGSGATWMDRSYINVYLSDGAKYTVTGLSCMEGDNFLVYYGYDAATDGNGTVSVKNGSTDVTSASKGYKATSYTFTATPSDGYKFKNWTKGAGGEVLGTDASINVTCEQNGQYQVYANFESDKTAQTITAEDVTATYGDTGKSVSGTTTGDGAISYSVKSGDAVTVDENTGALTIVKAGSSVITVTAAETATCAQATKDVNVTVNTKAMTVSAENVNVTVDGQPHGITVNVTDPASGATVKYGTEEGSYTLDASPTQTEAGELTVYYQVTADNYTTYTGSAKVTVSDKSSQTINASDVTATYGDTDKKVEATTDGNGAISYAVKDGSADYIDVDSTTGALTIKKVGTATVIVTAAETATYAQATKEVTVTINKANAVAATVTANNRTFDGTEKPLVTVTGEAVGGEMQYALGENATTAPDGSLYTTSIPTATDAGTYYVWYKAVGDATHSDSNPAVVTITISEETPTEPETDDGKTETEQKGSAPDNEKTSIDNDLTEIREIVSEEASVDDSDTVRLILNTNSVDESSDENKEAVDSIKSKIEADNLNIGSFLDITLSYIVEDANGAEKSSGQLTELNGRSLSVRFPIPSKLQASGRLFRIFRFHDGKAEEVGSGRGDAVVLSLDKFSLYAIAYEDGAATEETEESEKKVVKPHTHTYAWDKVEATESQDGELRYQCTECYDILVRVPLSAYYVFNANTVDKINKAKQGETVKITTDRWISFHKMVFDALTARPDVSLEVSFLDGEYKGNRVSFTIPAGADNSDLFTENNFAGFMYLGNKYGLTAEEN